MINQEQIIEKLEHYDLGDGVTYEYWIEPDTKMIYQVPIEIVRDWDNIKPMFKEEEV